MKSNFLIKTVALTGLAGLTSTQSYAQRGPGYGFREPPSATARVTAAQLTQFMQASTGYRTANADRWCYAMGQLVPGYSCPAPESFGFAGRYRTATVDAQTFLNNLRAYETGAYTAPFGPGRR